MKHKTIWSRFGFVKNPYQKAPLAATEDSLSLFTNRPGPTSEFLVQVDEPDGCVVVVSGDVGVGKTSFVNIQQHLLATGKTPYGPKILPCAEPTSPEESDTPTSLAERLVRNAVRSIECYCSDQKMDVPERTAALSKWLSYKETTAGYQVTIGLVGFGRELHLPPVCEAKFETWSEIFCVISHETKLLEVDGLFICIDNVETLYRNQPSIERLTKILMTFRDTLFDIDRIWWIIIGESGLYRLIDESDHRISQRIRGSGVEIPPFSGSEFHDLIEKRIKAYAKNSAAKSPLTKEVHDCLFEASCGAVRFALDTADILVTKIVSEIHAEATRDLSSIASPSKVEQIIDLALKHCLISGQIPTNRAIEELKALAIGSVHSLKLTNEQIDGIEILKDGSVRSSEFIRFGYSSEERFISEFLEYLHKRNGMARHENGHMTTYRLKGFVKLCYQFGLLNSLKLR